MAYDPLAPYLPAGSVFTTDHVAHLDAGIGDALQTALDAINGIGVVTPHRFNGDLQAWLDAPGVHKHLPSGKYTTATTLSITQAGTVITGSGTITASAVVRPLIAVNAADVTIGGDITLDGAGLAEVGVSTTHPGLTVSCREIRNINAPAADARGIDVNTTGAFTLDGTTIRNVTATGNADLNDMVGIVRGVVIASNTQPTAPAVVRGCTFRDITGEAAASIYVVRAYDPANLAADSMTTIQDVLIHNSSRRAVKVHSSRTVIDGVRVSADASFAGPNAGAAVDIMGSHYVTVNDLIVTTGYYKHCVSMTGTDAVDSVGHVVSNVKLRGNGVDPIIYGNWLDRAVIEGVVARDGGEAISLGLSSKCTISRVADHGGDAAKPVVNVNSTNTGVSVSDVTSTVTGRTLVVNPSAWVVLPIPASGSVVDPANTGSIKVKRVGDKVTIWFDRLMIAGGTTFGWILPNALPLGYRPVSPMVPTIAANSGTAESISMTAMHRVAIGENDVHYNGYAYSPSVDFGASPTNNSRIMHGSIVYETADPMP